MTHQQQQSPGGANARASLGPAVGQVMEFPDGSRVYAALRSDTCRAIAGFILVSSHLCLAARCARGKVHGVSLSPFLICVPFLSPADFDVDLSELLELSEQELRDARYTKFRAMGRFTEEMSQEFEDIA